MKKIVVKRFFLGLSLSVFLLVTVFALEASEAVKEVRGAWIRENSITSAEQRKAVLDTVKQANLNTIFLVVPPIGKNKGWSKPGDFQAFLTDAKAAGMSVHGWLRSGHRTQGLDYTKPAEQKAQCDWAMALLKAHPELEGIHFDFIRYMRWGGPETAKMNAVTRVLQLTRQAMKQKYPGKFLTATSFPAARFTYLGSGKWYEGVPQWYREWFAANPNNWYVEQAKKKPKYRPNWLVGPQHFSFQQNSQEWAAKDIVDLVIPMQYTQEDEIWKAEVDLWKSFLTPLKADLGKVCPGIGWLSQRNRPEWRYDAPALVRHIKYGRSQGMKGFVIFALGLPRVDDTPLVRALTIDGPENDNNAPYKLPAVSWLKEK
jgi:hypothetical protein